MPPTWGAEIASCMTLRCIRPILRPEIKVMEMAAVIIPEGIEMEAPSLEKAKEEGITVLESPLTAYEICARLAKKGLPGKHA